MNKKHSESTLLLGQALGQFGSSILSFVLGLHILKILNSVFLYSISQFIGPLVSILLLPVLGSAIDKFNKNTFIRVSQGVSCLALVLFAWLNQGNGIEYFQILALLVILKISDQILTTTLNASTVNVVSKEKIQSFRSKVQFIQAASMVFAPIIAIFIFSQFSLSGIIWVELVIEFSVLGIYWFVDFRGQNKNILEENQSLLKLFKEGLLFILDYKKIVFGLIFVLLINFILGIVNVGLPFVQIKLLALSDKIYALNDSLLAIGLLVGSVVASKIHSKQTLNIARHAISIVALGTCVLGVFLAFNLPRHIWPFILGAYFLILGVALTVCNILMSSWSMLKIPENFQGRVFAVLNALTQASLPLSMLLFGYIFDVVDSMKIFMASGLFLLFITLFVPILFKVNLHSDDLE